MAWLEQFVSAGMHLWLQTIRSRSQRGTAWPGCCNVTFRSLVSFTPIQKTVFALDYRQEPYEGKLHVRICGGGRR